LTKDSDQGFTHENEPQRTALVGLKSHGRKGMVGVKRTGSATLCKTLVLYYINITNYEYYYATRFHTVCELSLLVLSLASRVVL
jgi:hypothetical protein